MNARPDGWGRSWTRLALRGKTGEPDVTKLVPQPEELHTDTPSTTARRTSTTDIDDPTPGPRDGQITGIAGFIKHGPRRREPDETAGAGQNRKVPHHRCAAVGRRTTEMCHRIRHRRDGVSCWRRAARARGFPSSRRWPGGTRLPRTALRASRQRGDANRPEHRQYGRRT